MLKKQRQTRPLLFIILLISVAISGVGGPLRAAQADTQPHDQTPDPLTLLDARATEGAAAGYLADRVCGTCHAPLYQNYQHVGMARSFSSPAHASRLEKFGEVFYHPPSRRYYQIVREGEDLTFRRYQLDQDGRAINELIVPISWVLGSGNRARNYLYQTEWGELFLLPLAWYAEAGWGMSPGFEDSAHRGIERQVQRECMFCHNAFPEVPTGSDAHWSIEKFPHELPQGTGCQRCHGPGSNHVRSALSGKLPEDIRAAIVNPADLTPERRDSVCFQCHMLPHVAVSGSRRFGRGDYSFRPGELLSDYLVHIDVEEQGVASEDRFEINHHGYRLFQSRCYQESEGELGCISCHNPHVKPESTAFRSEVSGKCAECHDNAKSLHEAEASFAETECVSCHMPTRRTSDVVLVTMTDHRIATGPFDLESLVAPMEKVVHPVASMRLLEFGDLPGADEAVAYRSVAAMRANRGVTEAIVALTQVLQRYQYSDATPYLDLARSQLSTGDYAAAEVTARSLAARDNSLSVAYSILGLAVLAQGRTQEAIRPLKRALRLQPDPETHFNLALAYLALGDRDSAGSQIDAAIELRPFMAVAWKYRGQILKARGEYAAAKEALIRSLQLDPADASAYRQIVEVLRSLGEVDEADRYLEVGLRVSSSPDNLRSL